MTHRSATQNIKPTGWDFQITELKGRNAANSFFEWMSREAEHGDSMFWCTNKAKHSFFTKMGGGSHWPWVQVGAAVPYCCCRMYNVNDLLDRLDCRLESYCCPEASEWQLDTVVTRMPEHFPDRTDCYLHCLGMWMSPPSCSLIHIVCVYV